jgi:hypothetical protein
MRNEPFAIATRTGTSDSRDSAHPLVDNSLIGSWRARDRSGMRRQGGDGREPAGGRCDSAERLVSAPPEYSPPFAG